MARGIGRLSGADLRRKKPGLKGDGNCLWLQITPAKDGGTSRSWVFRYVLGGVRHHMGLGSLNFVTLKEARERARQYCLMLHDGIDPLQHRNSERSARIAASMTRMTFEQASHAYIKAHRDEWRNQEHAAEWPRSLRAHVFPVLGRVDVSQIDTPLIVKVLEPIWSKKAVTASRLRGRIESILDWATVSGHRQGDNPAQWSGRLEHLLAAPSKRKVRHHAALPWKEIPGFMAKLRETEGPAARAFEFLVLCAARGGEVRGATWGEIEGAVWTVPGERMKSGREHRVPLSGRCVEILREMKALDAAVIFPGRDGASALGESSFRQTLNALGHRDLTSHGFRSSFRDWCFESTNFAHDVCEAALAHVSGDATERAYRRGDALDKRRQLMNAWSRFCASPPQVEAREGKLISIGAAHA
jgi:integrase